MNNRTIRIRSANTDVAHAQCLNFFAVERHAAIKHNFAVWKLAKVKRAIGAVIGLENNGADLLPPIVGTSFSASAQTRFIAFARFIASSAPERSIAFGP